METYRHSVISELEGNFSNAFFTAERMLSPMYLYQSRQGIVLLDKRTGNVRFSPKGDEINISFRDPSFVVRIPLEN